jgi:hypothetical protein
MAETLTLPTFLANKMADVDNAGKEHNITERGTDPTVDLRDTDSLEFYTHVENYTVDDNHGDYEKLLIIRRNRDDKLFGATFYEAMNPDMYYDEIFPSALPTVTFKEVDVTERVVVTRDYSIVK